MKLSAARRQKKKAVVQAAISTYPNHGGFEKSKPPFPYVRADMAVFRRFREAAGRPERIDHRSYERQEIEKIPSIHMGVAAGQMERKGIVTEKGNINRQIAADNKLLKEIKARITRIYNWSKDQGF